ncbi:MAG TPA: glycosyltransferase [Stellaceae bacterium]|nr:glycosyltransferase [Stellaceae bacterium]
MEPLKILHVITGLGRGGAETTLVRLILHMNHRRFAPVVVSLMDEGAYGADLSIAGVPLYTLGMKRGRPSLGGLLRLRKILREEQPRMVQTWLYHADLAGLLMAPFLHGVPLVWNLRCSDMDLTRYVRTIRRILAVFSGVPAAVIVNSEAGRLFHESIGYRPRRWESIPNGFDTEFFKPSHERRALWRGRLGIHDGAPLIGLVARVDPMKDHATFLAAAARITKARPDAAFLLVGSGTDKLAIPPDLAGKVHALGERKDVEQILPALDLLLQSSAFGEGFPNAIGEAMACGVPAVATDVGDAAALIAGTGSIVPPRDPGALASAALAILGRAQDSRAQLGEAARKRIIDRYGKGDGRTV